MSKTITEYLQELDDIIAFTAEGKEEFMQDIKTQKAVIRSYEVVGEICKRLPEDFRKTHTQLDWRKLMSFRDFLTHNYEIIGLRYVWDAVQDVHNLREMIQLLYDNLSSDEAH